MRAQIAVSLGIALLLALTAALRVQQDGVGLETPLAIAMLLAAACIVRASFLLISARKATKATWITTGITITDPRPPLDALDAFPESDEVLLGWRYYSIGSYIPASDPASDPLWAKGNNVVLKGARATSWSGRYFRAMCVGAADASSDEAWAELARHHLAQQLCSCGIYSYRERQLGRDDTMVVEAAVVSFGWVIPAELGYRAERVRIERLYVNPLLPSYLVERLKERYEVDVEVRPGQVAYLDLDKVAAPVAVSQYGQSQADYLGQVLRDLGAAFAGLNSAGFGKAAGQ